MKAEELRIGNFVTSEYYPDFDKNGIRVESINEDGINLRVEDDGHIAELADHFIEPDMTLDKLRPIPLNEDWLLKFGFRKRKACGNYWFEKKIKGILFLTNDINPKIGFAYSIKLEHVFIHDMNGAARFKHVHLLQNIVFALTGTELEMK